MPLEASDLSHVSGSAILEVDHVVVLMAVGDVPKLAVVRPIRIRLGKVAPLGRRGGHVLTKRIVLGGLDGTTQLPRNLVIDDPAERVTVLVPAGNPTLLAKLTSDRIEDGVMILTVFL